MLGRRKTLYSLLVFWLATSRVTELETDEMEAERETVIFKKDMLSMIENLFSFEYILKYIFWEAEKKSTDYSLE